MSRKDEIEDDSVDGGLESLANRTYDEIPDEVLLPNGTFRLKTRNAALVEAREAGQNSKFIMFFIPKEAMDDVDADELPDDITAAEVSTTIWLERPRDWKRAFELLKTLGVDIEGKTLKEAAKAARGKEVIGNVSTRVFQSNGQTRRANEAKDFASVDE